MTARWAVVCLVLFIGLFRGTGPALGSEICTIDGHRVLLYKVINFWYDCLPEESQQFCGARLQCSSVGETQVRYLVKESVLEIHIPKGFGRLVSVLKSGNKKAGPGNGFLTAAMVKKDVFGKGQAADLTFDLDAVGRFRIFNVDDRHYRKVKSVAEDIGIQVDGVIGGLLNGKIALYTGREAMKPCPRKGVAPEDALLPSVKLVNVKTGEVLLAYVPARGE